MSSEKDKDITIVFSPKLRKECLIPDLSMINQDAYIKFAVIIFGYMSGSAPEKKALVANFVRTVDQIIREYNYARNEYIQYLSESTETFEYFIPLFRSIGHFENLISYLRRSIYLVEGIKRNRELSKSFEGIRFDKSLKTRIIDMRDSAIHVDERIKKGDVKAGKGYFLNLSDEGIEFVDYKIGYEELVKLIKSLCQAEKNLAELIMAK